MAKLVLRRWYHERSEIVHVNFNHVGEVVGLVTGWQGLTVLALNGMIGEFMVWKQPHQRLSIAMGHIASRLGCRTEKRW